MTCDPVSEPVGGGDKQLRSGGRKRERGGGREGEGERGREGGREGEREGEGVEKEGGGGREGKRGRERGREGERGREVFCIARVLYTLLPTLHTGTSSTLKVYLYWNVLLWMSCDTNSWDVLYLGTKR